MRGPTVLLAAACLVSAGCASGGFREIELPTTGAPRQEEPFAGPLVVESLSLGEVSCQGYPLGLLPGAAGLLTDLFLLIPRGQGSFDDIVAHHGEHRDLHDYWRAAIEKRLGGSGGFREGHGPPVELAVRLGQVEKETRFWWATIPVHAAANWVTLVPVLALAGVPTSGSRVVLDVTFAVESGELVREYRYSYDETFAEGFWFYPESKKHKMGLRLAELVDRFLLDLRADLARG